MRLAVLDDYQGVALRSADWEAVQERCEISVFRNHLDGQDETVERLEPFEILCVMRERTPFPRAVLERLPHMKLLVTSGSRNAAIDMAAAREQGITVCGTGSTGFATAELAFGFVIALARDLVNESKSLRDGGWQQGVGRDLEGATLGILGLGRLGSRVAAYGNAFGMNVIAWSQNLEPEETAARGATWVERENLFADSDFLTIHLRLSQRSRHLVDAEALSLMKSSAFLINTSRGPIVDERALIEAVNNGEIAGAALDVFGKEPLPADHPLRNTAGILCSPHIGYVTENTYRDFYTGMVDAVSAYLDGDPINVLE
jgi:phosphoglycerate dehydrogenase-like enzyme